MNLKSGVGINVLGGKFNFERSRFSVVVLRRQTFSTVLRWRKVYFYFTMGRSLKFDHKTFPYLHSDVGFRCVLVIGNYVDELLYGVQNDMLEHTSMQLKLLRVQKNRSEGRKK